jgi:hypothetical protein
LLRESLRVWHWQVEGAETVIFFTETQSHTNAVELVLAEKQICTSIAHSLRQSKIEQVSLG